MEKQLETIIKNQDTAELQKLIDRDFNISSIKLVEVFKTILYEYYNIHESITDKLNTQFIKKLIDNGVDIEYSVWADKDLDFFKAGLAHADIYKDKVLFNCFHFAIWFYDIELIKYFIEHGADINQEILRFSDSLSYDQSSVLLEASYRNDLAFMEYLINNGAKVIGRIIIEDGDARGYEATELLLRSGVQTSQFQGFGETPVKSLLEEDYKDELQDEVIKKIKLFVEYGVDVNMGCPINIIFNSHHFSSDEILELYNLFLNSGLDVNNKDSNGKTPLALIASLENSLWGVPLAINTLMLPYDHSTNREYVLFRKMIVESLINHGIDINAKDSMGMTALMLSAFGGQNDLVELLLKNGADINMKSEMTALDLSNNDDIKTMINDTRNHTPQKLVKILTNFTLDKPIKYTTHNEFGDSKEFKDFDGYMAEVKKQFKSFGTELEKLSPSLHKKIETFLLETDPDENYSWCSKTAINIGWSSLDELRKCCNDGKNPFDFELLKPIVLDRRTKLTKFGEVIELFKQEIEIRRDFKNLATVFDGIKSNLGADYSLTTQKIERQFYTDVEKFTITLDKIFDGIKKHSEHKDIEVIANEFEDGTIELRIIQVDSPSTLSADKMFAEVEDGDFADIKANLTNLCDWSVEGSFEESNFRINYLRSNNVKDIVELNAKPAGFTHVLKFYKR